MKQFVHISALGADRNSPSYFGRTRALGEEAVLEEFPEAVNLRPALIFGPEDYFYNLLARLTLSSPFLPLIAGGKTRFQPIYVGDLANAVLATIQDKKHYGKIYEIGGPDIFTFRQILDCIQLWTGRRRIYVPIPLWLTKLQAIITMPFPNALRALTLDQALMFEVNNVVNEEAVLERRTLSDLGVKQQQSSLAIVPGYLEHYRVNGQFSRYIS